MEGDASSGLRQWAKQLGITVNCDFLGRISREDKRTYMQSCTIYCQVSRYEGFGMAVAEAMACGAPVLVSNSGALPELVGSAGAFVEELSVINMHAHLRQLLQNAPQREWLSVAAVQRIANNFSISARKASFAHALSNLLK